MSAIRQLRHQLTEKEAIRIYESGAWEALTNKERAVWQMYQDRLFMPFSVFHKAVGKTLGRPVWTHEFASGNRDRLTAELEGK